MVKTRIGESEFEVAFDPERTRLFILAWPDGRYRHEIASWSRILPDQNVFCIVERDLCVARNKAVRDFCKTALGAFDQFLFIDADMRPDLRTLPFLQAEADLVGCMYPTGPGPGECWADPGAIHCGLFRFNRKLVEAIGLPWFSWDPALGGCEFRCECPGFVAKVRTAGLSVARAGWCGHRDWA